MKKVTEILLDQFSYKLGPLPVDIVRMTHGLKPYNRKYTKDEIASKYNSTPEQVQKLEQKASQLIIDLKFGD